MKNLLLLICLVSIFTSCGSELQDVSELTGKWYDCGQFGADIYNKNHNNWVELKDDKTFEWKGSDGVLVSGKFRVDKPQETTESLDPNSAVKTYWKITFYDISGIYSSMWDKEMTIYDSPNRGNYINGTSESEDINFNFCR